MTTHTKMINNQLPLKIPQLTQTSLMKHSQMQMAGMKFLLRQDTKSTLSLIMPKEKPDGKKESSLKISFQPTSESSARQSNKKMNKPT